MIALVAPLRLLLWLLVSFSRFLHIVNMKDRRRIYKRQEVRENGPIRATHERIPFFALCIEILAWLLLQYLLFAEQAGRNERVSLIVADVHQEEPPVRGVLVIFAPVPSQDVRERSQCRQFRRCCGLAIVVPQYCGGIAR